MHGALLAGAAPLLAGALGGCGGGDDDTPRDDAATNADASRPTDAATGADASPFPDAAGGAADSAPSTDAAASPDATVCVVTSAAGPSDFHGHTIAIPNADLLDPRDRAYSSTGGTHVHTVNLTAAQLTELASSCSVTVMSNDTHPHTWVITMLAS